MDASSSDVFKKYVSDLSGYVKADVPVYQSVWPPEYQVTVVKPRVSVPPEVLATGDHNEIICYLLRSIGETNPRYLDFTWRFWPLFRKNWLLLLLHNKATWYEHAHLEDKDFTLLWSYLFPLKQSEQDKDCAELTWHKPLTLPLLETQTRLRELIQQHGEEWDFVPLRVGQDEHVIYSRAIYFFILAHDPQWWRWAFEAFKSYYPGLIALDDRFWKNETFETAFMRAALNTNPSIRLKFMLQDKTDRNPAFVISASFEQDIYFRLKDELWIAYKGPVDANLRKEDPKLFAETFEGEWEYLKGRFSDIHFGFTVHPRFTFNDMISYACLPKGLKKLQIVSEIIDYAVLRVAPTAMLTADQVDSQRVKTWMQLIAALCGPFLAEAFAKLPEKVRPTTEQMEPMMTEAIKEIWNMAGWGYNFWYKKKAEAKDDPMAYFMLVGTMQFAHLKPEDVDRMQISEERKATLRKMVKWTRPSYYLLTHLREKYLDTLSAIASKQRSSQRQGRRPQNYQAWVERRQQSGAQLTPLELEGMVIDRLGQEVLRDGKRYLLVDGLAERLERSSQTIRNLAKRGEIPYIWARMGKRRAVRLIPFDDDAWIEDLKLGLLKDTDLARAVGLSPRQLRNIKHRLAQGKKLSRLELKRSLVAHLRTRRSS